MQILSHRGYWQKPEEKNAIASFERSFRAGFGVETDVRDHNGELVISHDPPREGAIPASRFFELHRELAPTVPLALNIKADGLQKLLRRECERVALTNYFLFDMTVPDLLASLDQGLRVFTRQSEVELQPALYQQAAGVWLDLFYRDWFDEEIVAQHLLAEKEVCLVSPELHRRDHRAFWKRLRSWQCRNDQRLMICTDHPLEAKSFFNV